MRVLHCLTDMAAFGGSMAAAERRAGADSWAVALRSERYGFRVDEVLCGPEDSMISQELRRWRLLGRAVRSFDVVHFNFGRSIAPPWKGWGSATSGGVGRAAPLVDLYLRATWQRDLPLLRAAGKAMFVTFQGDDARQAGVLATLAGPTPIGEVDADYYTPASDRAKAMAIGRFERWADGLFALNPDLLRVLPSRAEFLPYPSVDPAVVTPAAPRPKERPLVLHAPTHRGVKGTRFVVAAVERLQAEGVAFDFRLVEGVPHAEALALYAEADLLVDQLLVGWYGALAVELMALGRPVVCYVRDADLAYLPPGMAGDLPIIRATPDSIEAVLRTWLTDRRGELASVGARSRAFVERWHDPSAIADRTLDRYDEALRRRPSRLR